MGNYQWRKNKLNATEFIDKTKEKLFISSGLSILQEDTEVLDKYNYVNLEPAQLFGRDGASQTRGELSQLSCEISP